MDKVKYFIGIQDLEDEERYEELEENEDYEMEVPTTMKKI